MTSEQFSAQENLTYIKQIMNDTCRSQNDNGIISIVWGILVTLGQIGNYVLTETRIWNGFMWLWLGIGLTGWLFVYIETRAKKEQTVRTFASKILASLWVSAGISMTVIGFGAASSGLVNGYAINPLISTVLGGTYYVTGLLNGKKLDQKLSYGWWLGAVVMFMLPGPFSFLLFAFMMVLFQVIPGILSYRSYKAARGA